jgi:uncharacterized protein (DUF1778 family)
MAAKKRPRGRPPLPRGQEREEALQIRLRAVDRRMLEKAARKAGQTLSGWARDVLLREAGDA